MTLDSLLGFINLALLVGVFATNENKPMQWTLVGAMLAITFVRICLFSATRGRR